MHRASTSTASWGAGPGGQKRHGTFDSGYSYHVIIDHGGGFASLYVNNSELNLSSEQGVSQGEVFSACGPTGRSTGDHLHFEIRVNGAQQDPLGHLP